MRLRFSRLSAAALAALVPSGPAGAQDEGGVENSGTFQTGEQLYQACTSKDEAETEHCFGYIMGVSDTITLFGDYGWVEPSACVPNEVSIEELRGIVVDYIEASEGSYSAVSLVHSALEGAYPCDGGEPAVSSTTA